MKNNKKKTTVFVTLLIVIACLTVGYALLSTTLNINGTGILSGNTWDIHWANVQVNSESTQSNTQEAIISSSTQVVFNINLNEPGDFYEFTVDAVNEGTIDGMIDVISTNVYQSNGTTPATLPSAITYSITYDDDTPLEQYQLLSADSYETYKIRVEYKRDIENSELITTNQTYVMKVSVTYKQADENASGGAQKTVSLSSLRKFIIYVPPTSEQQRIVSILDTFEASITNLEAQLAQRQKQYEYYRNQLLTFE